MSHSRLFHDTLAKGHKEATSQLGITSTGIATSQLQDSQLLLKRSVKCLTQSVMDMLLERRLLRQQHGQDC